MTNQNRYEKLVYLWYLRKCDSQPMLSYWQIEEELKKVALKEIEIYVEKGGTL